MLDISCKSIDYCMALSDLAGIVIDMLREAPPADETKLKLELIRSAARTQIGPLIQDMEQGSTRDDKLGYSAREPYEIKRV
ncbi:MAG: hypothetical protein PVH08_08215 [Syntrophobacterales bacterium]|jgi:hypothetical protein